MVLWEGTASQAAEKLLQMRRIWEGTAEAVPIKTAKNAGFSP